MLRCYPRVIEQTIPATSGVATSVRLQLPELFSDFDVQFGFVSLFFAQLGPTVVDD